MKIVVATLAAVLMLAAFACQGGDPADAVEWNTVALEGEELRVDAVVPDDYYPALRTRDGQHIHNIMRPYQKPSDYDPNLSSFLLYAEDYNDVGHRLGVQVQYTARLPLVTFIPPDKFDYEYKQEDVLVCFNTKNPDLPWNVDEYCRAPGLAE